jgi:hypothetical protein
MTILYSLIWHSDPGIYIPQGQTGPVILPGTGFLFRRLLQISGMRWEYSKPPQPVGVKLIKLAVKLQPTINRPVCLCVLPSFVAHDQTFLSFSGSEILLILKGEPSLTIGWFCTLHCIQFLVKVALDLWPYFVVSFETDSVVSPSTGFPLCRLVRLADLQRRYSNPPPHGYGKLLLQLVSLHKL